MATSSTNNENDSNSKYNKNNTSSKVLVEGILHKKGQINMSWKERYFILNENGIIKYYENYNESKKNKNDNSNEINLNEVKAFSIITEDTTSKKSDREFTFQLITISRTYTLSCQHIKQFNKWTKYIEKIVYGKIINKGYLFKLGVKRKKWKKRWFILYDSKKLMYYENDKKVSVAKGIINLKLVSGLGYGQESQYQSKIVIELKTSTRIWALKCLNEKDLKIWFDSILKVMNDNIINNKDKLKGRTKALSDATKPTKKLLSSPKGPTNKSPSLHVQHDSMFNLGKQISIDFNLSDDDETKPLSLLPENGKFNLQHQPFKFSSDKTDDEKKKDINNDQDIKDNNIANKPTLTSIVINDENDNVKKLLIEDEEKIQSEYKKIQIKLYREWENIMKDIVINKKHTLTMDASSNYCIERSKQIELKKQETAMTPTNPDQSFIASIPKMPSRDFDADIVDNDDDVIAPDDDILSEKDFTFDHAPKIGHVSNVSLSIPLPKKLMSPRSKEDNNIIAATIPPDDDDIDAPEFPEEVFGNKSIVPGEFDKEEEEEEDVLSPKSQRKVNQELKYTLFDNCQCIQRLLVIMRAYSSWIKYKTETKQDEENDNEGFRGMISILSNYTIKDLLNDYYHIKRFHCESTKVIKKHQDEMMGDVRKTAILDPDICNYFQKKIDYQHNPKKSISIKRNCNEKLENQKERRTEYLLNSDTKISSTQETVEIVTQQILDMIHCYVFHLSYCIRNVVGKNKSKFVTLTKIQNEENEESDSEDKKDTEDNDKEPPMDDAKNDGDKNDNNEDDDEDEDEEPPMRSMERQYSRWDSHHGTDIQYNTETGKDTALDKMKDAENTPKYSSIKFEVLNCDNCISEQEWIEIYYKSELILQSFEASKLKCKKDLVIEETANINDKKVIKKNEFFAPEYVVAIQLYCNFDLLRNELIMSYRNIKENKDIIKNHYHKFYHFGKILYIIIEGYGINMYDSTNNISSMESTSFYHCFSNPVLFQNLRCEFNGPPVSMTIIPSVVFTSMYIEEYKRGIIVEMDITGSGMTNYFDVSIFSNFAYESERLFYGKISLNITNIIESDITSSSSGPAKLNYHSNYLNAITLLRMIIGDCNMQKVYYENEIICERLTLLISLEINLRRMKLVNNNSNKKRVSSRVSVKNNNLVPEYIEKLFHTWCLQTKGVIVLKLSDILKLSGTRLQSYFLMRPRKKISRKKIDINKKTEEKKQNDEEKEKDSDNNISLSYKILFQIFPFVTKILCYGINFNEYLAKTFTDFLTSKDYINNLQNISKVNECILQFDIGQEQKWDEWQSIIEKYQKILDENKSVWSIKAKIPGEHSLDTPKISFVKKE